MLCEDEGSGLSVEEENFEISRRGRIIVEISRGRDFEERDPVNDTPYTQPKPLSDQTSKRVAVDNGKAFKLK